MVYFLLVKGIQIYHLIHPLLSQMNLCKSEVGTLSLNILEFSKFFMVEIEFSTQKNLTLIINISQD